MWLNRAFHDNSVLYYLHMEKIIEVSLPTSEKVAVEKRVCARRRAMLQFGVVNKAVTGGSQAILED